MGVYTRFKRQPGGFRALVELLETTPVVRRKKMIDVGMAEDPDYTQDAVAYMLTFEDILALSDMELAELISKSPPRTTAFSVVSMSDEIKQRFLKCSKMPVTAELKDYLTAKATPTEIGGAQMKVIEVARQLERKGIIKAKHIPEDI
ncbi:MAG: hypothetical protein A2583_10940 [Bdellovibrionales bacterium RIFOXYD1_FULL_53_11]|nr:MAG: hypothetical protein A2583_10940 [Bdellovibrionales bacterium RIFOXYD1_FULL_53_11]